MKNLTCEKCGKSVTESTVFCPECGAAIFHTAPVAPSAPPPRPPVPVQEPMELAPEKFDCKKLIPPVAVVLAVILALVLGWNALSVFFVPDDDPQLSTQPSTQQTSPSTIPTQKPTETITPTQPTITETEPTEPDFSWYVVKLQYMSYQDFFAVDRTPDGELTPMGWNDPSGQECVLVNYNGFQIFRKSDSKYLYVVPNSESLADSCTVIGTNGKYAYLHNDSQILQLDLLTGVATVAFTFDELLGCSLLFREMCYIVAEMNDTISLCRLYLPTMTLDVLYDGIPARTPRSWLSVNFPSSTQGVISWVGISPEMVNQLYAEFSNPESAYYPNFGDNYEEWSQYWEDPDLLRKLPYHLGGSTPMMKLQEDKNLQALWKGTYSIADGTVTQDWGVVDTCWFGSGYGHDHWNPELTADIPPTVLNSEAIPISGLTPPSEEMAEIIRKEGYGYDGQNKLYKAEGNYDNAKPVQILQDGEYMTASDLPHVSAKNDLINCKYYSYYASVDNTLIRLGLDGNVSVIYTAKYGDLRTTCYYDGNLYFRDGDTIVMIDTVACTSRELLSHPGNIYVGYDDYDQKLYIETVLGLAVNAYLFDPITGTLEDTIPHL